MSQQRRETKTLPTFGVTATAETPTKTIVETRNFEFVVDEPQDFGGENDAPTPVEYLIGSWAGCLNVVCHLVADEKDIEFDELSIEIEGDLDPAALTGEDTDVRPGYQEIEVAITAATDADDATLTEWLDEVETRCPVGDNLTNPTPVELSIAAD